MDIATRPDLLPLLSPPSPPALDRALDGAKQSDHKQQARVAAEKFEAFFLRTVLEDMIPEPKEDAFGGGSNAEKLWNSMLHEQYAEILARRGGIGIADLVYRQLLTLQEAGQEAAQESDQEAIQATPSLHPSALEEQAR